MEEDREIERHDGQNMCYGGYGGETVTENEPMMAKFGENGMDQGDDTSIEALTLENTEKVLDGQTIDNVPIASKETLSVEELLTGEKEAEDSGEERQKQKVGDETSFCKEQEELGNLAADEAKRFLGETMIMDSFENIATNKCIEETEEIDDLCQNIENENNEEWSSMEISTTGSSGASPDISTGGLN